jgi:hypothetical protein
MSEPGEREPGGDAAARVVQDAETLVVRRRKAMAGTWCPQRCLFWLMFVLLMIALAGCLGGGESVYSVYNQFQSCSWTEGSGSCKGSLGRLSGAYPENIKNDSLSNRDAVQVRAEVSVEQGKVNVSVESPEGEIASVAAGPGSPVMLEGLAEISFDEFNVTFEAVDGEARGISYTIEYQLDSQSLRDDSGAIVTPGSLDVYDVRVGDCYNNAPAPRDVGESAESTESSTDIPVISEVYAVPCDERHDNQVYARFDLPDGDYPGDDEIIRLADDGCMLRLVDYIGTSYGSTRLDFAHITPSRETWEDDDRRLVCVVYDPAGPLEGSVAGAGDEYLRPDLEG